MSINAPTIAAVLMENRAIPIRRETVYEGLLKRVGRRVEDMVLSKLASRLVGEIYRRDRFESKSGYGRRTTNVYVSVSSIGTMLVFSREDCAGYAVSFELAEYTSGYIVVRIDEDLKTVHPVCAQNDIDGIVDGIIGDVGRTRMLKTKNASADAPSFLHMATNMPLAYGATTIGGLGALAALWFGLDMIAVLAIAGAATSVVSGRPVIGKVIDALSDLADDVSRHTVPTEKPADAWLSLEKDIRDGSKLRERFEAARSRLTGSIDLADVEALALMEGTLTRVSRSHERAMGTASSVARERAIVAESRKALDHVITAAERRTDLRSDVEMREHVIATTFAIQRSRDASGNSLH